MPLAWLASKIDAVEGEHLPADQALAVAHQEHLREQRLDLLGHSRTNFDALRLGTRDCNGAMRIYTRLAEALRGVRILHT